ncbi:MAG: beta-lactamase family protein [Eubacterium sp.]|nr:beta-lactamase family protein [Eubacterium sp.]
MNRLSKMIGIATALGIITAAAVMGGGVVSANAESERSSDASGYDVNVCEYTNGFLDYENGALNDERVEEISDPHIYGIGSVSKMYATTAVMQLVEEGKVELDGPVTDYIPNFRMADERYKDITVRMLMDHTSGIMGSTHTNGMLYLDNNTASHDELLDNLAKQRLKADPGEYACYCNDGFCLLEIIVEEVTDMSFTDYIEKNIVAKTGGESTGTAENLFGNENLVPPVAADNKEYEQFYCMEYGAGGLFSTSSDVANFGAAFFKGDNSLLSETSKEMMATRWSTDEFKDDCGLGWDFVELPGYEEAGVKVMGKGGDVIYEHAMLLVAPEEKISVAVTSNGGSSALNAMLASELLKEALEEEGIEVNDPEMRNFEMVSDIPEEYLKYEGWYSYKTEATGGVLKVTFPDKKYMHVEEVGINASSSADYILSTEGNFVEAEIDGETESETESKTEDIKTVSNPKVLAFEDSANGQTYITVEKVDIYPELGSKVDKDYFAERLMENPVSDEVLSSWERFNGKAIYATGDIYSSYIYDCGIMKLYMREDLPGYVLGVKSIGTALFKIQDAENAVAFNTLPDSANRDMLDIHIEAVGDRVIVTSNDGLSFITEEDVEEFDGSIKSIELKSREAKWFKISDNMAGSTITVERPENSAVYTFNKYGEVVYTSHFVGASNDIPLPKDGKILFVGETGSVVNIE